MYKTYTGYITKLAPNQIFVFGSNTSGRHGKGAALWAVKNAGAIRGKSYGLQGQSYAIITKDLTTRIQPSISKRYIIQQVYRLYRYIWTNPDKEFIIAYSGTGINLNGYTPQEMADIFSEGCRIGIIYDYPDNIVFEEEFSKLLKK